MATNNEITYTELQDNFHRVCDSNNEMKAKIEELTAEIRRRDKVVSEWNTTLESVDGKIQSLETENADLKKQLEEQNKSLEAARNHINELDELNDKL